MTLLCRWQLYNEYKSKPRRSLKALRLGRNFVTDHWTGEKFRGDSRHSPGKILLDLGGMAAPDEPNPPCNRGTKSTLERDQHSWCCYCPSYIIVFITYPISPPPDLSLAAKASRIGNLPYPSHKPRSMYELWLLKVNPTKALIRIKGKVSERVSKFKSSRTYYSNVPKTRGI